jgi:pyruvate dehydrogenase E1 component alpha subunit
MDYPIQTLEKAYRLMKTIREFEERMRSEYQQGKLPGFIHIYRIRRRSRSPPVSI